MSEVNKFKRDFFTKGMVVTRSDHSYIHEGLAFGLGYELSDFANNEIRYFMLETPANNKYIHFKNVTAKDCLVVVYEGAIVDETGAVDIDIYNRNRIAEVNGGKVAKSNAKLLDVAPDLNNAKPIKKYQSEYISNTEELVLLNGEKYVISVKNLSGNQANVFLESLFYEEEG